MSGPLRIVFAGLSITSSWGNGHATNYRGLVRALAARGHDVLFLERDKPWYAAHRDLPHPPYGRTELYDSIEELRDRFDRDARDADLVVVGSYVPEGVRVGRWVTDTARGVTAFYDIDTPVTLAKLARNDSEYLAPDLVPRFNLYLSFTGGPVLRHIEEVYGSPAARPFHCLVDPDLYYPEPGEIRWDLGYLGTYSDDRQPTLDALLLEPARQWSEGRFAVAGPQYPPSIDWPRTVERIEHLPPPEHRAFYNGQRFTLNVTRADMIRTGYAPSVRLFEAAACGVPVISDSWTGLDDFFRVGEEILVAQSPGEVLDCLKNMDDDRRREMGERARRRVLSAHTAEHRAERLATWVDELRAQPRAGECA